MRPWCLYAIDVENRFESQQGTKLDAQNSHYGGLGSNPIRCLNFRPRIHILKVALPTAHVLAKTVHTTRDSSAGRAEDCSWYRQVRDP